VGIRAPILPFKKFEPVKDNLSDYTPESRTYLRLCDLPADERPRERLYHVGEKALFATELLVVIIGSGHGNDNVLQLAQLLLGETDGLPGLARATTHELRQAARRPKLPIYSCRKCRIWSKSIRESSSWIPAIMF
jgi:DNA repair protein RadC